MNAGFRCKLVLMTLAGFVAQAAYGFDGSEGVVGIAKAAPSIRG